MINRIKKYGQKKVDLTIAFLWILLFIVFIFFGYIYSMSSEIKKYSIHDSAASRLKECHKDIDNFILNQNLFSNSDSINKTILEFDKNLKLIDIKEHFRVLPFEYRGVIDKIKSLYIEKQKNIEYVKSEKSQLLYSILYLFELNHTIENSKSLNIKDKSIVNKALLDLLKYHLDTNLEVPPIIDDLSAISTKSRDDEYVELLTMHIVEDIARIKKFKNIAQLESKNNMEKALASLQEILYKNHKKNILIVEAIIIMLFVIVLLMLIGLIFMSIRSLRMKDELLGFKTAIENSYNSIIMTDANRRIIFVNEMTERETGYSKDELIGKNPRVLKSGLNSNEFYTDLKDALINGKRWEGEFINKRKDGSLFYEKASIIPIFQDGEIVRYLAIKLNITDYIEEQEKVRRMAYHDQLTSLPNRFNIEEYLKKRLLSGDNEQSKIAILFIDIDRFKTINDTLGHDVGDELLIEVSKRLETSLSDLDTLSRFGGDEFVILLESIGKNQTSEKVCRHILKQFSEPIQTKDYLLNITLSIGVSCYPQDSLDYKQLFKYADVAMYKAKNEGKNTYRNYKAQLSVDAHKRLEIEQSLKSALKNREIYVVYQPKYRLKDRVVVGIETLARWDSKNLGLVNTEKFISIAEETGFIVDIGLFIFERACKDFSLLKESNPSIETVSINISSVQFYQSGFIDDILEIIDCMDIEPNQIILEITETQLMKNIEQSIILLKELKNRGFSVSIDDFGTGYSSLGYLKQFPIDELKIDRSFIKDLPEDKSDVAILKAIITLSETMDYINVAEGIESIEQEKFLLQNNCSIGQGYYFCRPKRVEELIEFFSLCNKET